MTKLKIVLTISAIWIAIILITLFIVLKLDFSNAIGGVTLLIINSIIHATVAFNVNTIYNYLFKFFEKKIM